MTHPLIKKFLKRAYSWSCHNSFDYDKEQWFQSYIMGLRGEPNAAMLYGNVVGDSLGGPAPLVAMPTLPHKEFEVRAKLGDISLVGFLDFFDDTIPEVQENKTSSNTSRWTMDTVHKHKQLDFYAMLLMLPHSAGCKDGCASGCVKARVLPHRMIRPEELRMKLYYIPVNETADFGMEVTKGAQVGVFETTRTTKQVFSFMVEIRRQRKAMVEYATMRLVELAG